ncbi:MAG: type II and III secretion system protein family protein, partial [Alphaproteobacteria bacterium]
MIARFVIALLALIVWMPTAAPGAEIVGVTEKPIALESSEGALVRLDSPAATVFVADPEIADIQVKSPRLIYLFAKKPGETTLYAVDAAERVLLSRRVTVSHNLDRLAAALKRLVPDGRIQLASVGRTLVLSGSVRSAASAEDARHLAATMLDDEDAVINRLAVLEPNQVHLRVRVAEVSRDILKVFGINWDSVFANGNFLFGLATGNAILAGASPTNSLIGSFSNGMFDINGLIDALDKEDMISILAEPNLTALSGQTATFLAGGEFPILVPENDRITVVFKEFGVSLAFTPTLLGGRRISLQVKPEVSELSSTGAVELGGFTIPALTTRRAETTVELGSGQSFAIAGLLRNNVTKEMRKFPGLGDLPILGTLFRSDAYKRQETELVIIVTPYIVRPVSRARLAAPTD